MELPTVGENITYLITKGELTVIHTYHRHLQSKNHHTIGIGNIKSKTFSIGFQMTKVLPLTAWVAMICVSVAGCFSGDKQPNVSSIFSAVK